MRKVFLILSLFLISSIGYAVTPQSLNTRLNKLETHATAIEGKIAKADSINGYRSLIEEFDILNTALWDTTSTISGIVDVGDSTASFYTGHPIKLTTSAGAQTQIRLRYKGAGFFGNAKYFTFRTRIAYSDTTACAIIVGLAAATDSATGVGRLPADGAFFFKRQGAGAYWQTGVTNSGSAVTDTTAISVTKASTRLNRMTWTTLEIVYDATSLRFYKDGTLIDTSAIAPLTTTSLLPFVEVKTSASAAKRAYVDYIFVNQLR